MKNTVITLRHLLTLVVIAIVATAQAAEDKSRWTLDASLEHIRQTFADTDGRYTTFTLTPAYEWGKDWQVRLDLPWQKTQGEVVLPRTTTRLSRLCEWALEHPRQVAIWLANGKITQAQLDQCNHLDGGVSSTESQGLADIVFWLNRFIPLNDRWAMLPQLGYKTDSGNADKGLGTGTQDLLIETGVYGDFEPVSLYAQVGYERILQQDDTGDLDDFNYASIELEFALTKAWAIGAGYHIETAQVDYLDDMRSLSALLRWQFLENYSAELSWQTYNEESGYPDRELGVSLNASF